MTNYIGTAEMDITPAVGGELAAYHRDSPSTGVLDPLQAGSFYISDGHNAVSITSIDLVALDSAISDRVRDSVAHALGLDRRSVLLHVTHTHSSPWGMPRPGDPDGAAYLRGLARQLVHVARRAAADPAPCLVGWTTTEVDIGENRREVIDGQVVMGRNPDGPVDRRLGTLLFSSPTSGQPLALLVTATAHANVLTADSTVISGDYPSWARALLRDAMHCPVMFVQGAAGDVNAVFRGRVTDLERMARATAGAAIASLAHVEPGDDTVPVAGASRDVAIAFVDVPSPHEAESLARRAAEAWQVDTSAWTEHLDRLRADGVQPEGLSFDVAAARIGDWVMGGVPMEVFSQIALDASRRLGSDIAFLRGYTNGYFGYLPTTDQIPLGGYEVLWSVMVYGLDIGMVLPLQPGSAERVEDVFVDVGQQLRTGLEVQASAST